MLREKHFKLLLSFVKKGAAVKILKMSTAGLKENVSVNKAKSFIQAKGEKEQLHEDLLIQLQTLYKEGKEMKIRQRNSLKLVLI